MSDGIPGVTSAEECPGRLLIDISLLSTQRATLGIPSRLYCYKFFNADGTAVGQGTFDLSPIGYLGASPIGRNWGVDVWDREELALNQRTYDNFITDGSAVGTTTPDVLWFEIAGGWFFDYDQDEDQAYATWPGGCENLLIQVKNASTSDYYYAECALRIAGLGTGDDYIVIHTITTLDWFYPGVPGWPGKLDTGNTYILSLDDPHFPGVEYTFAQNMAVTGTNPND